MFVNADDARLKYALHCENTNKVDFEEIDVNARE